MPFGRLFHELQHNIADVIGVSKVLLCPNRYLLLLLMVNSKNSKFNSASTPGS